MSSSGSRILEVDVLRGFALVMMIAFHLTWDLNYLGFIQIDLYSWPQAIFAYSIGTLFLLLVGVSLTLSYARASQTSPASNLWLKYFARGIRLLGLGALITIATWLVIGEGFIVFGVISCIGLSIILAFPFIKHPMVAFGAGAMVVIAGVIIQGLTFQTYWLLWLGFAPSDFFSVDYFPILPWLGVVLIGIAVGNWVYGKKMVPRIKKESKVTKPLARLGRHSLAIYLIHQPLILGILLLLSSV